MTLSLSVERWTLGGFGRWLFVRSALALLGFSCLLPTSSLHAQQRISEDRDLKEIDLTGWDCLNKPEGTGKTPDGAERNRLKNRSMPPVLPISLPNLDTPGFLKYLADFEAQTKNKRRKDLGPAEKQKLDTLEKQIVQFTGYLVLAYCGPPESTNCGSVDFHDWHLEVFEKPADHPPEIGDPTPIICEIAPRTQNAIYRSGVRIQDLTAFFRKPDVTSEPTGHPAIKIRLTGYLLWDDEHNGTADIGQKIQVTKPNKYHQPWRSTAWELHPVLKIERADASKLPLTLSSPPAPSASTPATAGTSTPAPDATPETTPVPTPTSTPPPFVTITQPVKIRIPYGETILARGTKLPVVSRNAQTVTVKYLDGTYPIPISSTDSH